MASKVNELNGHMEKPWRARAKRDGVEYFLGYFKTKKEAEECEAEFKSAWPVPQRTPWNKGKRIINQNGRRVYV